MRKVTIGEDKKEGRKRRKEAKAAEVKEPIKPSIKTGRFGDAGASGLKPTQLFEDYEHKYKKEFVQASLKLKEENDRLRRELEE